MAVKKYDLAQMQRLAVDVAQKLKKREVICLFGDLGAGKTTFSKAIISELVGNDCATSPTFNIMQSYTAKNNQQIYHFDLYRIQDKSELNFIGLQEAFYSGITLIEWPEIALHLLPQKSIKVYINFNEEDSTTRTISIHN